MNYLHAPEFNSPIKRGREEVRRKVYLSSHFMTVYPCYWSLVALKHLTDTCFAVNIQYLSFHTYKRSVADVFENIMEKKHEESP